MTLRPEEKADLKTHEQISEELAKLKGYQRGICNLCGKPTRYKGYSVHTDCFDQHVKERTLKAKGGE